MARRSAARLAHDWQRPRAQRARQEVYASFDRINGEHPWQQAVPEGYVLYPARKLPHGRVVYFNFALAKSMGLIPESHPQQMSAELHRRIIDTFSLQIINEYDQAHGTRYKKQLLKEKMYMATRYLQLQHSNKQGKTSGDGRSVWNGTISHKGQSWDVSSRGTGVTCLAPGAVEAQKPLKTGAGEFGYGCGLADIDEMYGSAVMSEVFHRQGVHTERTLAIIDLGKGLGIGVRAAPSLIRPAHLFLHLKQGNHAALQRATELLLQRQQQNGNWQLPTRMPARHHHFLRHVSKAFAEMAALLERQYIFAWLDWDGDNVLADAGIIDYGSIRQFGLRHDQYRYDDVDRYSTNLNEQRFKARLTVQVFAQMVDFLKRGRKLPLQRFRNHTAVRMFDFHFDQHLRLIFLQQVGLTESEASRFLSSKPRLVERLYSTFSRLERTKTKAGMQKLPDGINRPAIFNMRKLLREFPGYLLQQQSQSLSQKVSYVDMLNMMSTSFAKRADLRLSPDLKCKIREFHSAYVQFVNALTPGSSVEKVLKCLEESAAVQNRSGRITGNGGEFIVDEIMKQLKRGTSWIDVQRAVELFVSYQSPQGAGSQPVSLQSTAGRIFQTFVNLAHEHEEDI